MIENISKSLMGNERRIKESYWPLVFSLLVHIGGVLWVICWNQDSPPSGHVTETVELWVDEATTHNNTTPVDLPNEAPLKTNESAPSLTQGDIKLAATKKPIIKEQMREEPKIRRTPTTLKKIPLKSAQHIIDDALTGISKQTKSVGMPTQESAALNAYKIQVIRRIRPYIDIPSDLKGNPTAEVNVRIAPNSMEIIWIKLIKSSGNSHYDAAILRALQEMGQFPPAPHGVNPLLLRSIILTFRPYQ